MTRAMTRTDSARGLMHRIPVARMAVLFLFHTLVFSLCFILAWLLRFDFTIPRQYADAFRWSFPLVVAVQLSLGFFFGFYRGWWSYVGITDVLRLVTGLTSSLALLLGGWYLLQVSPWRHTGTEISRGMLLIDWAFALLALFGARVMARTARERRRETSSATAIRNVLIVGAGDAGEALLREIQHRPQLGLRVIAFVDDDPRKRNSQIRGIRVDGPISDIARIADESEAAEALLAIPSAPGPRLREIIRFLSAADLKFKTMPGMDQIVSGKVHVSQLRPVNLEDLLRRDRIVLPGDPVARLFRGRRVLITGAGGTIGSELAVQVLELEPEQLVLIERSEFALYEARRRLARERGWLTGRVTPRLADIRDEAEMRLILRTWRPEIVIHAAAHKHVPMGEENPGEYVRNNCLATRKLGEACIEAGVERFVFISTDKAIRPSSVMGASKRAGEIALLDLTRSSSMLLTVVRFGNVLGSSGSVIPLFMEQIAAGGPVTVTHPEVTRYFIRTSEAISLVLQAATLGNGGQVYMLDMGQPILISDLARDLIRLSNHSEDEIPITFTGLRPGEKLFEEIRLEGESIHPTDHPQIVITESPQPDSRFVAEWLRRLEDLTVQGSPIEVREGLG